jgi:hypothetical protein
MGDMVERIKRMPKVVWIAAIGLVIGVLVLKSKGQSVQLPTSQVTTPVGDAGGGGGSTSSPAQGQNVVTADQLSKILADQQASENTWFQSILDQMRKTAPPVAVKPPSTPKPSAAPVKAKSSAPAKAKVPTKVAAKPKAIAKPSVMKVGTKTPVVRTGVAGKAAGKATGSTTTTSSIGGSSGGGTWTPKPVPHQVAPV